LIYKDIQIPYKQGWKKYNWYLSGDWHVMSIFCIEDLIKKHMKIIGNDEHSSWVHMGDIADMVIPSDNRFDPSGLLRPDWLEPDDFAECTRKRIKELIKPARHNCEGIISGNHSFTHRKHVFDNFHKHVCEDNGVDNLGYSCGLRLFFKRENSSETHVLKMWLTHGNGGGRTLGAKVKRLEDWMKERDGDIYGFAHVHDYASIEKPMQTLEGSFGSPRVKEHTGVGALTGCYLKAYMEGEIPSYGEIKVYSPTVLGCVKFEIDLNDFSVMASRVR